MCGRLSMEDYRSPIVVRSLYVQRLKAFLTLQLLLRFVVRFSLFNGCERVNRQVTKVYLRKYALRTFVYVLNHSFTSVGMKNSLYRNRSKGCKCKRAFQFQRSKQNRCFPCKHYGAQCRMIDDCQGSVQLPQRSVNHERYYLFFLLLCPFMFKSSTILLSRRIKKTFSDIFPLYI